MNQEALSNQPVSKATMRNRPVLYGASGAVKRKWLNQIYLQTSVYLNTNQVIAALQAREAH